MGLSINNCSVYPEQETKIVFAPNPNPVNFKIIQTEEIGCNLVAQIDYPDCINFAGMKICVFKNMNTFDLYCLGSIDPHFSESKFSPFARLKPDQEGWNVACMLARSI